MIDRALNIDNLPKMTVLDGQRKTDCIFDIKEIEPGLTLYTITINPNDFKSDLIITWKVPAIGVLGAWKYGNRHDKRFQYDWETDHINAHISFMAPVISLYNYTDKNHFTFACSDTLHFTKMNALLREEDNHFYCFVEYSGKNIDLMNSYSCEILIDQRPIHFSESLVRISNWWATQKQSIPCAIPEIAKSPLYSTWYSFHQNLEIEALLKECRLAYSLGLKWIIIDDGWQTNDTKRGYDYVGDWLPERFVNMRAFVAQIKSTGMQLGLWFAVPYCGKKSMAYQRFKGKFLTENHHWAPVLDPRFPEVREYIISTYSKAVSEWGIDALKLDFIDDFTLYPESETEKINGRDYADVNEAVYRLLSDIKAELLDLNPDIGIEFRQWYTGPIMRKFGNMFRAFDCPNDALSNRIMTTDLKLLGGNTPIHSDMITWHQDEKLEIAALQLINVIFSVPQLSINLHNLNNKFLNMIQFIIGYWSDNRHILLDGYFTPFGPSSNYPVIRASLNNHAIYAVFAPVNLVLDHFDSIDIVNGQAYEQLALTFANDSSYNAQLFSCEGCLISSFKIYGNGAPHTFNIPIAGILQLNPIKN